LKNSWAKVDVRYNMALSQVFGPSLLKRIDDPIYEENLKVLLRDSNLYPARRKWNFVKGLEMAYSYLKQNYRCEYVYKNEIANQLLLRFHSDNSATLLKEIVSDNSIADIVIVNGHTVAYEIKTELDSLDRLSGQLNSYRSLYDKINIVTHSGAVNIMLKRVESEVGILVLQENGELQILREAVSCEKNFDPAKAGLTLRQSELISAYEKYEGRLPLMGTAFVFEFCYQWFVNLAKEDAHIIFAEALKSRKLSSSQFELVSRCSPALKMLFLGKELSKKYCNSTIERLGIFV